MTDLDETWLAELTHLPSDHEVAPGLTVSELTRFHARPETPKGCRFEARVQYGSSDATGRPLELDVYHPSDASIRRPGVLFVHGGAWSEGHRYTHIRRACLLAEHGWVAATMSYRLSSEAKWPAPLLDVWSALRWMGASADRLGLDPSRIAVAGNSAGGHLAAMAALACGQVDGGPGAPVAASALWYPVTDLASAPALRDDVKALLGPRWRKLLASASPLNHVTPEAPPMITFIGAADELVPLQSVVRFHEALGRAGVQNELHVYPGAGHAFDFDPRLWSDTFDKCRQFLDRILGPST